MYLLLGNIGLGYETCLQLAKHNPAHIYLAARNADKASAAIAQLQKEVSTAVGADKVPPITHLSLDLSSFASVSSAATVFKNAEQRLDLLINNAGIMATLPGTTAEGYEIQFGTNHMGHALLTRLLLPILEQTATASPSADVRVINLASLGERFAPKSGICFSDLESEMKDYSTWARYGQSKLANVLYTKALAKKYPNIIFASIHPGAVKTNLSAAYKSYSSLAIPVAMLTNIIAVPVYKGAWNQEWAATAPRKLIKSGVFLWPVAKEKKGSKNAQNKALEDQLWDWTQTQLDTKGF